MDRITFNDQDPTALPRIRDTKFTVREVYGALLGRWDHEEEILARFPGLDHDDLVAAEQYILEIIRSRTHDDITGRPIMPRDQLQHGHYYKGRCRHATVARWNADDRCFYHWREKFGRIYIEDIKYPTDETEPGWDTFDVVEELQIQKFEIPFDFEAAFTGNQDDLFEHNEEMWRRVAKRERRRF
jgi:uncharacterized protein (DUF433 family)